MRTLILALAATLVLASCEKKQEPLPKPDEIRALEKAKEAAKKLNEKAKETNEAGRDANEQKSDTTKSDTSP